MSLERCTNEEGVQMSPDRCTKTNESREVYKTNELSEVYKNK